jgi:segregation and condensation protein B
VRQCAGDQDAAGQVPGDESVPADLAGDAAGQRPSSAEELAKVLENVAGQASDVVTDSADDVVDRVSGAASELPGVSEDAQLEAALEALLLVVDSPTAEDALATAMDVSVARVAQALPRMADRYTAQRRGFDLRRVGGGWRFYTRDAFAPFVERLLMDGQHAKLTRAALETLAVIAYRQPVTRSRVAAVRGVSVDGVIRTLQARGLIEETGIDRETGGHLFRTTELFLERLGLSSLDDLPPIAPLLPDVDAIDDV